MKRSLLVLCLVAFGGAPATAQTATRLTAQPERIQIAVGESAEIAVRAYDASGRLVSAPLRIGGPRNGLRVANGRVTGLRAGDYELVVSTVAAPGDRPVILRIPVQVDFPPVTRVEVRADATRLFEGARTEHSALAFHADGSERPFPEVTWTSSDPEVATVDRFGTVRASGVGSVTISASVEGVTGRAAYDVTASPVML